MIELLSTLASLLLIMAVVSAIVVITAARPIRRISRQNNRIVAFVVFVLSTIGFVVTIAIGDSMVDARTASQTQRVQPVARTLLQWGFETPAGADTHDPTWYAFNHAGTAAKAQIKLASGETGELHFRRVGDTWQPGCFTPHGFLAVVNPEGVDFVKATRGCGGPGVELPE